jgi:hypothetical protein
MTDKIYDKPGNPTSHLQLRDKFGHWYNKPVPLEEYNKYEVDENKVFVQFFTHWLLVKDKHGITNVQRCGELLQRSLFRRTKHHKHDELAVKQGRLLLDLMKATNINVAHNVINKIDNISPTFVQKPIDVDMSDVNEEDKDI